jgi:hypothetical protein
MIDYLSLDIIGALVGLHSYHIHVAMVRVNPISLVEHQPYILQ